MRPTRSPGKVARNEEKKLQAFKKRGYVGICDTLTIVTRNKAKGSSSTIQIAAETYK